MVRDDSVMVVMMVRDDSVMVVVMVRDDSVVVVMMVTDDSVVVVMMVRDVSVVVVMVVVRNVSVVVMVVVRDDSVVVVMVVVRNVSVVVVVMVVRDDSVVVVMMVRDDSVVMVVLVLTRDDSNTKNLRMIRVTVVRKMRIQTIKGKLLGAGLVMGVLYFLNLVYLPPRCPTLSPPSTQQPQISSQPELVYTKWWQKFLCKSGRPSTSDIRLPRLIYDVLPRKNDNNVFLLDTACNTHPRYRDWCAAESWARHNPDLDVWYLFTSLTADDSDNLLTLLLHQYSNLKVATVDLDKIFHDTPLESFFKSNIWRGPDTWPVQVLSNMLRVLVLWYWGGVYTDTDAISVKTLDVPINAVSLEVKGSINNAFLSFTAHNPILLKIMEDISKNFKPSVWASSGPKVITRVMRNECKNDSKLEMIHGNPQSCNNITIYPIRFFSPIDYTKFQDYFAKGNGKNFKNDFNSSYLVHFWNNKSKKLPVSQDSESIYDVAAQKYCPVTYQRATLRSNYY
ncbi:hypothetical protein Pcinc_042872 [Petrolisthes cinctipes]|uniref:Alpha 1,4-glycosyltransferase domain-containing protein n=1 Tax=Petrolisthes cinctipes TaxID=88211 RepID=A0AAE1EGM0_PETCI|nr:hypothetical protein Pcinc_042872 [Petrolisthes cinctipes]